MDVLSWLKRAENIDRRIKQLCTAAQEAREEAYERATCVTPAYGEKIGSRKSISRKPEEYAIETDDQYYRRYLEMIDERSKAKAEITEFIETRIENNTYATILLGRFVNLKTWEKIAEDAGYSREHVIKSIYPKAIQAAEKEFTEYHT